MGSTSMSADPERIVIVGAGECGTHAAMALREQGFTGAITLLGRESVHAYERPPLSKGALAEEDPPLVHPWTPEQLTEAGVDLRLGVEATEIDRTSRTVSTSDGPVEYDRLLLAAGAQARRLDLDRVIYLRTHEDAAALRTLLRPGGRLLVIGAGFIGLEIAAAARERDLEVTVVEAASRALARMVPEVIAEEVVALHAEHGVPIRTSTTVVDLRDEGPALRATLSDGTQLVVDGVIAGVGASPATELAESAGLPVEAGIVVDEYLRTADPRIWAAGDCAAFPDARSGRRVRVESWRNAHDQAVTVAASMTEKEVPHAAVPWFWSDHYDQMLQVAGLPGVGQVVERWREDGILVHFGLDADGRLVHAAALGRGPAVAKDIRVAEKIIAAGIVVDPAELADPTVALRSILRRPQP